MAATGADGAPGPFAFSRRLGQFRVRRLTHPALRGGRKSVADAARSSLRTERPERATPRRTYWPSRWPWTTPKPCAVLPRGMASRKITGRTGTSYWLRNSGGRKRSEPWVRLPVERKDEHAQRSAGHPRDRVGGALVLSTRARL